MEFPQKLNIELPHDPAILLLGIHLKRIESRDLKRYLFTAALFAVAKR